MSILTIHQILIQSLEFESLKSLLRRFRSIIFFLNECKQAVWFHRTFFGRFFPSKIDVSFFSRILESVVWWSEWLIFHDFPTIHGDNAEMKLLKIGKFFQNQICRSEISQQDSFHSWIFFIGPRFRCFQFLGHQDVLLEIQEVHRVGCCIRCKILALM